MKNHYQDMSSLTFQENGYSVLPSQSWLQMCPPGFFDKQYQDSGWKFRLSVHPDDVKTAWNIAVDVLVNDKQAIHVAKVAQPTTIQRLSEPDHPQAGKMITIYTTEGVAPDHYKNLMQSIETRLHAAGIRPGLEVSGDRKVPGSGFVSYRNDKSPSGAYQAASANTAVNDAQKYNPFGFADPYQHFALQAAPPAPAAPSPPKTGFPGLGSWQHALTGGGEFITRIPVHPDHSEQAVSALARLGLHPELRESASLGLSIRLKGDEALKIAQLQSDTGKHIGLGHWQSAQTQGGEFIARAPVRQDMAQEAVNRLSAQGFNASIHHSDTLGLTVRVRGADAQRMMEMQNLFTAQEQSPLASRFVQAQKQPQTAAPPPPRSGPANRGP